MRDMDIQIIEELEKMIPETPEETVSDENDAKNRRKKK